MGTQVSYKKKSVKGSYSRSFSTFSLFQEFAEISMKIMTFLRQNLEDIRLKELWRYNMQTKIEIKSDPIRAEGQIFSRFKKGVAPLQFTLYRVRPVRSTTCIRNPLLRIACTSFCVSHPACCWCKEDGIESSLLEPHLLFSPWSSRLSANPWVDVWI